jgi:hypothetical protein
VEHAGAVAPFRLRREVPATAGALTC